MQPYWKQVNDLRDSVKAFASTLDIEKYDIIIDDNSHRVSVVFMDKQAKFNPDLIDKVCDFDMEINNNYEFCMLKVHTHVVPKSISDPYDYVDFCNNN